MRIIYTITKSEIGGAQRHVWQLAKNFKDQGHEVAIVASPGGWLEDVARSQGVLFFENKYFANSFNPIRVIKSFLFLKRTIFGFSPDIVHTHSSFAGFLTRLVVRGKIPTIFTAHSWAFTDGVSFLRKFVALVSEKFVSRFTDYIICVSEFDLRLALKHKIANPKKLITIYNGVEDKFRGGLKKEKVFLSVGRLAYPKMFDLLIEAFASVKQDDYVLEIIGDGPEKVVLENKIKSLGILSKVKITSGFPPDKVQEKMESSFAFVLISKHEGFPMTILEAMSASLPVVASCVGGIPEQVTEKNGFLVKNNVSEVAQAIKELIKSDSTAMGEESRKIFLEKFSVEVFIKKTEEVYKKVLGR